VDIPKHHTSSLTLGLEADHYQGKEIQNFDGIITWPQLLYEDATAIQENVSQLQESPMFEIPIDPHSSTVIQDQSRPRTFQKAVLLPLKQEITTPNLLSIPLNQTITTIAKKN